MWRAWRAAPGPRRPLGARRASEVALHASRAPARTDAQRGCVRARRGRRPPARSPTHRPRSRGARLLRLGAGLEGAPRRHLGHDPGVVVGQHLDEARRRRVPVRKQLGRLWRARLVQVLLHIGAELGRVGGVLARVVEGDHLHVAPLRECALRVVHVGDAARHARGEVAARAAEHHTAAAGHVLAAVVAHALHHGEGPRVAHAEALARAPAEECLARRRAVERRVAHDHLRLRVSQELLAELLGRVHGDLAAREPLAAIVVGIPLEAHRDAPGEHEAEGLPRVALEVDLQGARGHARLAVALGEVVGDDGAEGAVHVCDGRLNDNLAARVDRLAHFWQELHVEAVWDAVVLLHHLVHGLVRVERLRGHEHRGQVQGARLGVEAVRVDGEALGAANHLGEGAVPEARHVAPDLLGHHPEEVDHVLGLPGELLAELRVLGGDAHGARVEVALAHHNAPERDKRRRGKAELLGAQERRHDHVAARLELAVRLQGHPGAEAVEHEGLVGLGEADLHGHARVLDRRPHSRPCAAVAAGDHDVVRLGLGHARGDHADAHLGDELHGDARVDVGRLEVVDELGEVLDGVDVMVRRRRDEADTRRGAARLADELRHLVARELAALAGLGALGHLDLELVRVGKVVGGDAEAARGDLLDCRPALVGKAQGVLAALARVRLAAQRVHRLGERLVGLRADGPEGHGPRGEALDDGRRGLHLVEGHLWEEAVVADLEEAADGNLGVGRVHEARVLRVRLPGVGARRLLQGHHGRGRVVVGLAAVAPVVVAEVERVRCAAVRGVAERVEAERVVAELVKAHAPEAARGPAEARLDHLGPEAHCLEDLGALVGLHRGDAHLGHDLEDAKTHRLLVARHGRGGGLAVRLGHAGHGAHSEARAHRVRAVAHEGGEVVHLLGVGRVDEEAHARAEAILDEGLVHRARGEE
mmetsp:Transcript_19513/g.65512  ORF Transcript_19513/g.65512 Transcript_19513/m.65512 type:complete len:933 (-) Transcript_19513:1998-4796(-)